MIPRSNPVNEKNLVFFCSLSQPAKPNATSYFVLRLLSLRLLNGTPVARIASGSATDNGDLRIDASKTLGAAKLEGWFSKGNLRGLIERLLKSHGFKIKNASFCD